MRVLFLGYTDSPLVYFLIGQRDDVITFSDKINVTFILDNQIDFIISYGYRYLIKNDVLELLKGKVINLHISYLPYNRGADPNFWSFIDNTVKGVSIHLIDEGIDTGDILVQKEVDISENETLKSSYDLLQREIQKLFMANWSKIKTNQLKPFKPKGAGTFHKKTDKNRLLFLIQEKGYDTPVQKLINYHEN